MLLRPNLLPPRLLVPRLLRPSLLSPVGAKLLPTLLTSGSAITGGKSQATASISPLDNRVIFAAVANGVADGALPTAAGCGLTWVQVATVVLSGSTRRTTVFRALGAPTAGAVTFTWGTSQTGSAWSVVQFAGADTSGANGAGAVVQSVTQALGASTGATNTLAALGSTRNVHLAYVMNRQTSVNVAPDIDFAELAENANTWGCLETQWAVGEVNCSATWTSDLATMISIEVKAA